MPAKPRRRGAQNNQLENSRIPLATQGEHGAAIPNVIAIFLIMLATQAFKKDVNKLHEQVIPYKVVDIPGRGKGMVALRDINSGERILAEKPLFVVPSTVTGDPVQLMDSKLKELTEEQQESFFNLTYVNAGPNMAVENIPLAIFQTNGIAAGPSQVGIFPKTARLNHACSSGFNTVYSWREKEGILGLFHIFRELLTTYFDTKQPRDSRRDHLSHVYGFICRCKVCSLPPSASGASDARLQQMTALRQKLSTWGNNEIDGIEALNLARQIWLLSEEEGYWSERGQLAADAAHVAAAHSDEHAAREWSTLAQEWYGYELGQDSIQVASMHTLAENPRRHSAWATKDRMNVGGPQQSHS
ncbi:hypothetical protein BU17DRAFT_76441 [Hysterangium stoloniferum]|nr:hypothetical protein BU17DRAFT_76441 [Hysterangium stoloniferum]